MLRSSDLSCKPGELSTGGGSGDIGCPGHCPGASSPGTDFAQPLSALVKKSQRARPEQQTKRKL